MAKLTSNFIAFSPPESTRAAFRTGGTAKKEGNQPNKSERIGLCRWDREAEGGTATSRYSVQLLASGS